MKKILVLLSFVALASCKKEAVLQSQQPIPEALPRVAVPVNKPQPVNTSPSVKPQKKAVVTLVAPKLTHNAKDSLHLAKLLHSFEDAPQIFKVSSAKTTSVTGKGGTVITINPNNLVAVNGSATGSTITVELKELLDTQSLLKNNAQTMSGDKLLVSGGSYYIGMASNGNELQLKPGKTLEVQFPKLTDQDMELFYGDNSKGQMDWQKAGVGFDTEIYGEALATAEFGTDNIAFASTGVNNSRSSQNLFAQRDTITGISANANSTKMEKAVTKKLYETVNLNKLGWINCDSFYNKPVTNVQYAVIGNDSLSAVTFLVFKDINSVVSGYYDSHVNKILNMPANRKATFIMIAVKDEKIYAHSGDIIIQPGIFIKTELKEISEKEVAQLFEKR